MNQNANPDLPLAAVRLALCSAFLVSAALKIADLPGAAAEVRGLTGFEPAAFIAIMVIVTQLGGSAFLIFGGRFAWLGAVMLGGFTLVATLVAHDFWTKAGVERDRDMTTFFEHIGLIAGLLLAGWITTSRPIRGPDDGAR